MEKTDVVPYLQYGVHVVGIHYGRDSELFGNRTDEPVNDNGGFRVET